MQKVYQTTITEKVNFKGEGLHTGKVSNLSILPGKADQGILFKRIDLKKNNLIQANYKNVSSARLCTTLENQHGIKVSTVEHLLASFYILGIDNVVIEIDNEEVPIMDGSAKNFMDILEKVELKTLSKRRSYLKILDKIELVDGKRKISIEPNKNFQVDFQLNYKNKIIGNQRNKINLYEDNLTDIFNSRTFCLYEDIEDIKSKGLAKGGSLENAIVVNSNGILNSGNLRNAKEFVNHKILDCIGDLYTSGYRIIGSVICSQGGHYLTNQLLKRLFENKENFSIIEIQERNLPHTIINRELLRSIA